MKQKVSENVTIRNAQIRFRNFEGKEGKFNTAGRRNFCVFLEDDIAKDLTDLGWNIRYLDPIDEGDKPQAYVQVAVSFDNIPPNIYLVSSRGKNKLTPETVNILDWAEIENVDLTMRPYHWNFNGKEGIKPYLKTMYVTIVEDELDLEDKYYNVPDSAVNTIGGCGNCDGCDGHCHETE